MLIVLLLLYIGSQLASSLMMSSPMMDKTQRQLMLVLPLFFVVIVINFPAGLLVYWITTNLWTMGQQYAVRRMIGSPAPPVGGAGPPVAEWSGDPAAADAARTRPERVRGRRPGRSAARPVEVRARARDGGRRDRHPQKCPATAAAAQEEEALRT